VESGEWEDTLLINNRAVALQRLCCLSIEAIYICLNLKIMGLVYADVEIINYADETLSEDGYLPIDKIRKMKVNTMADSGAIRLSINENIKQQLGLRVRQQLNISLADGTKRTLDVAGPIRLKFMDRDCITDAFVLPNNEEPLIGAVPMELMDLVIIPSENKLMYNPQHPDGPLYSLK